MKRLLLIYSLLSAAASPAARADVTASALYVPVGYDDTDEIVVVVEGYLKDSCQRIRTARVVAVDKTFEVYPQAETYGKDCEPIPVPYLLEVVLNPKGPVPADNYVVKVELSTGSLTQPLEVRESATSTVDSRFYAPVDRAEVGMLSRGRMRAVIEGRFQNTCIVIDKIELSTQNGLTYEMLPQTKMLKVARDGSACRYKERPFTAHEDFDEPAPGRYLLHVRSLNGKSVNHIFTNVW